MYQEIKSEKKLNVRSFLEKRSIVVYVLSILMGMAKLSSGATPFGLALLGAIGECGYPLILPLVIIGLSTGIAFGGICLLKFIIAATIFIVMKSFIKGNTKTGLAAKMLFATAISEMIVLIFSHTLIYDGIMAAFMSVTTAVFFLVFSEGLPVFLDRERKITTYESLMATGVLLTVVASCFGKVTILGLSITNIICILVVMYMGWRKGMTCGVMAGLSVSMVLGIIGLAGASTVATYVVCGFLSGILSRFGKVGAIIGFALGNAVWAFYCNASTEIIIPIGEIIVASLFLFFLPKRVTMAVDHIFDIENVLEGRDPVGYLAESTIAKLKSVSDVADDMATNVENGADVEVDEIGNYMKLVKENACKKCSYYTKCWEKNYHSFYEVVFNALESLKESEEMMDNISLGKCENPSLLKAGLQNAYAMYQVNKEWGNRVKEDKRLVAKQLRGVSQAIHTVGKDLRDREEEKKYLGAGYHLTYATVDAKKQGNKVSGDSIKYVQLKNGKILVGISDGMGTGENASQSSQKVLSLIEKYFNTGLEKKVVVDLMNSYMMLGETKDNYATLDILLWDEEIGNAQIIKSGACPTFIVENNQVRMVSSQSLPVGSMINNQAEMLEESWNRGTIIVMISDGILEAIPKKENGMIELLASISKNNMQRIADIILQEAIDANMGIAKDDMSVVVLKVC